jgi:peptide deformylase
VSTSEERQERRNRDHIDSERRARRDAALQHIRQWGDPVLRAVTNNVSDFSSVQEQVDRMSVLMDEAIGCGLAAPQVGSLSRLFIYKVEPDAPVIAVVNPQITWRSDEVASDFEGCLSLEPIVVEVERPVAIRMEAQTVTGENIVIEAEDFEARVIQHEYDHVDGILILDRTEPEQKREALEILRRQNTQTPAL